jgi:hypothetical protein
MLSKQRATHQKYNRQAVKGKRRLAESASRANKDDDRQSRMLRLKRLSPDMTSYFSLALVKASIDDRLHDFERVFSTLDAGLRAQLLEIHRQLIPFGYGLKKNDYYVSGNHSILNSWELP